MKGSLLQSRFFCFTVCLLCSACLIACNGDPILLNLPQTPEISQIYAPARAFLSSNDTIAVHVRVDDPQGPQDIAAVELIVRQPAGSSTFSLALRDDGTAGDILAGDGQFIGKIAGSMWQRTGIAGLVAWARDRAGNRASSDTVEIEIAPGERGSAPFIRSVVFPDSVLIDSTFQLALLAEVDDADGLATIDSVRFGIYPPSFPEPSFSGLLLDDGLHGDNAAGDGLFGVMFSNRLLGPGRGLYTLRVQAQDRAGNLSRPAVRNFAVRSARQNLPPVIVSVAAPDTISRTGTGPFVLRVVVSDPNGLGDIARVFFNTFLPGGQPSSGNPFFMRDDGVRDSNGLGDTVANDGEYALTITISASNATGTYLFEFQAEDRGGLLSEKFLHRIVVVE